MRIFIAALVLIFSFQLWTKADDIGEFEIEGLSLGDSLLKFKKKSYIKETLSDSNSFFYKNKKFAIIGLSINSDDYDAISATIKPHDKKYILYAIEGRIFYKNDMDNCIKKKSEILNDLQLIFKNKDFNNFETKHTYDKTGKSLVYGNSLDLSGGSIDLFCIDWSKKLEKSKNFPDELKLMISSSEFNNFINNEAYD